MGTDTMAASRAARFRQPVKLPRWLQKRALPFAPYVEPTILRHALVRRDVYVLRPPALNHGFDFGVEPLFAHRCIFFHVPKTGGLSVSEALFGNHAAGHLDVRTARLIFGAWRVRTYFKFTFVRNPWDRLVSAYFYLRRGHPISKIAAIVADSPDFTEFVKTRLRDPLVAADVHLRPQSSFLLDDGGRLTVDFLGRFESLERDFSTVARRLCLERTLPHRNTSAHPDFRRCYDEESRAIVADFYRRDIELFGYRFD
jgi:hypothetical protein